MEASVPAPDRDPGLAPTVQPPSEEHLFGQTLVREGVLSRGQLAEAVRTQADLRAQGVAMRLGEVLVQKGLATPQQVRQFLDLVGKQILHCSKCGRNYNVKNWAPGRSVFCPQCSIALAPPPSDRTLDASATQVLPAIPEPEDQRAFQGRSYGRYRLLDELGRGGMGVVWKAWDTELKRVVALKQVLGESNPTQLQRFMREAQSAARLQHPGIVAVHDVGVVEGQHYFTTDYIAGQSLDKRMTEPTPPKRALELVKQVAEALAYAHEQGVVHRDVKPSNILIDGKGRPYVADFGLAKEVSKEALGTLTASGELLGTPAYMSPEQAAGRAQEVGPASDQFSLGVVLYELLTQKRPFDGDTLYLLMHDIQKKDPARPSHWNRKIHRDVETICLKALEKDPSRRYPSLSEMAADIGRYLDGEPIEARPVGRLGRWARKARRHPGVVVGIAAAVLLAATGATLLIVKAGRVGRREAVIAQKERALPLLQRASEMLRSAQETYGKGTPQEMEALLKNVWPLLDEADRLDPNSATASYERAWASQLKDDDAAAERLAERAISLMPEHAEAHLLLGRLLLARYLAEVLNSERLAAFKGEMAIRMQTLGADDADLRLLKERVRREYAAVRFERMEELGQDDRLYGQAMLAFLGGEFSSAEALFERALSINPRHANSLRGEVYLQLYGLGQVKAAIAPFERLRALGSFRYSDEMLYGRCLSGVSRFDEALEVYGAVLTRRPHDFEALCARGTTRMGKGDREAALADYSSAIDADPRQWSSYCNRAWLERVMGRSSAAIKDCEKALELDPRCATAHHYLGLVYAELGNHDAAMEHYTKAIEIRPTYVWPWSCRGVLKAAKGDLAGGLEDCTRAIELAAGQASESSAWFYSNRASVRQMKGDFQGQIADLDEALKINPGDPTALAARGDARRLMGDLDRATADYDAALKIDSRNTYALICRGIVRQAKGDLDGAMADYEAAVKIDPHNASALNDRGNIRKARGDLDGAMADYEAALKIDPSSSSALICRGHVRQAKGDLDGAMADYEAALKIDPRNASALNDRGNIRKARGDLDGAMEDYNAALVINPQDGDVLCNRGTVRKAKGDLDGAMADYDASLKIDARNAAALNNRGTIRYGKGDLDGAMADFEAALVVDPGMLVSLQNECGRNALAATRPTQKWRIASRAPGLCGIC